jgi:copper(I)-binding protein
VARAGSVRRMERVAIAAMAASLAAVACTSNGSTVADRSSSSPQAIVVEGTWASAVGPRTALVYFLVSNPTSRPDVLIGATSEVGGHAVLRQTTSAGSMRPVDHVTVPAGGEVAFEPGSYDVALAGVKRAPRSGDVVRLELRFEGAGGIEVSAGGR